MAQISNNCLLYNNIKQEEKKCLLHLRMTSFIKPEICDVKSNKFRLLKTYNQASIECIK